jgi:hypothetical protein
MKVLMAQRVVCQSFHLPVNWRVCLFELCAFVEPILFGATCAASNAAGSCLPGFVFH